MRVLSQLSKDLFSLIVRQAFSHSRNVAEKVGLGGHQGRSVLIFGPLYDNHEGEKDSVDRSNNTNDEPGHLVMAPELFHADDPPHEIKPDQCDQNTQPKDFDT